MAKIKYLFLFSLLASGQTFAPPYINNGTSFFGHIYQLVPPGPRSNWNWVNQGSAIVDSNNGELTITMPAYASDSLRIMVQNAPIPPYTVYAKIRSSAVLANYQHCGILFRESSTGKQIILTQQFNTYWNTSAATAFVYKYLNNTTLANPGAYVTAAPTSTDRDFWWKIIDDGSNLSFYYCLDKSSSHCFQYGNSISRTDFLISGPDQIGFYVSPINSTYGMSCSLIDWDIRNTVANLSSPKYTYYGFTGSSSNGNIFTTASSYDGLNWNSSDNNGSWSGQINAPQLINYNNSKYFHVATAYDNHLNYTTWKIGLMNSSNIVNDIATIDWSSKISGLYSIFSGVPYQESGITHIFIPASITDLAHFSIYETHATHNDGSICITDCTMQYWSDPQAISVDTSNIYDSAVSKIGSNYYMWFTADTTNHYIGFAKSSALLGPYSTLHIFTEWGKYHEGPTLYAIDSNNWRLAIEDISHNYDSLGPSLNQMMESDCNNANIEVCSWTSLQSWHEDKNYRHGFVSKNF